MTSIEQEALGLLHRMVSPEAAFRDHQLDAIASLVEARSRVLLVQKTGWGKSAVYLIATRMLRDRGAGATILISPLLALMRNQIDMAKRGGVHARTINSSNTDEWEVIAGEVDNDRVDLLLISPERLNNLQFRKEILPSLASRTGLLVVDEVHCISDWGHDFRPDYRRVKRVLDILASNVPVLGTTATANERVVADIGEQFGTDLVTLRGPLQRDSLRLYVIDMPSQAQRLAWLASYLPTLPGTGIVYCLTVEDTLRVSSWLRAQGIDAPAYSGETDSAQRERIESALLENRVKAVVATSALGMGFDKPDLGFVVHYQSPGSPVGYYQQVGRAGRALPEALGILMRGAEDSDIQDYFISTAFPPRQKAERVIQYLAGRGDSVPISEIQAHINVRKSRLEAMLKILEVDGAIERVDKGWRRTLKEWSYDSARYDGITALRRREQSAMVEYATTKACLMAFLQNQLDDHQAERCGRCGNCLSSSLSVELDEALVAHARDFLRTRWITLKPRKMWPANQSEWRGRIGTEMLNEEGRALCHYGDGGWGGLVASSKISGSFPNELVEASRKLMSDWNPEPAPTWVTCVPSPSHVELVAEFAAQLAGSMNLPFHNVIRKVRENFPQKEMENSAQQFRNVFGAFEIMNEIREGPVLLVDDIVDSGWTLTIIGAMLRDKGCEAVLPFVLALARGN